jgi:hypothetical protein
MELGNKQLVICMQVMTWSAVNGQRGTDGCEAF